MDYVTCVQVDEDNNPVGPDGSLIDPSQAQRRIVAAKQTTLFEAEDKEGESKCANTSKKGGLQTL